MDKKNIIISTLIIVLVIIIGAGIWFWPNLSNYFTSRQDFEKHNQNQEEESDLIKVKYDNKIVYNNQADLEKCESDCDERGGTFNDCGSICSSEAEVCAEVCGKVCVLESDNLEDDQKNGENDNSVLIDYNNENLGFSLKYPESAEIKEETGNRIEFVWLGPEQEPGTEITDGVRVLVSKLDLPPQTSLKEHLQEKLDDENGITREILSDIRIDNQYDYTTYAYTISSLGEYKHLIAPINSQKYFDISVFTSHDYYQDSVDEVLKTFKITDSEKIFVKKMGEIVVDQPLLGQNIATPLKIKGQAVGSWFFEGSFKITLADWDGRIITESVATANDDWMTEEMVPFEAELEFEKPDNLYSPKAILIFEKSNPSGLPEKGESLEYFVYFD